MEFANDFNCKLHEINNNISKMCRIKSIPITINVCQWLYSFWLIVFMLRQQEVAAVVPVTYLKRTSGEGGVENALVTMETLSKMATILNSNSTPTNTNSRLPPPPIIKLNKCCLFGEYLDMRKTCVAGSSEHWVPIIYQIYRKTYYSPQGSSPKFIQFDDNVFPIATVRKQLVKVSENNNNNQTIDDTVQCTVDDLEIFTGVNNMVIFSNGSLFLTERTEFIPPHRYCVDQQAALVCFPKSPTDAPKLKLKKCCGKHGIHGDSTNICVFEEMQQLPLNLSLEMDDYQTIFGLPKCLNNSNTYGIAGDWSEMHLYHSTGDLYLPKYGVNLSANDYCLENVRINNSTSHSVKVFACLHQFSLLPPANSIDGYRNSNHYSNFHLAILRMGLVISVVFLAATLLASYLMPSIHHVLHWKCQIYYVFCLFVGDLLLAYTQLSPSASICPIMCQVMASIMHFFFLAAFFWLNTMCFNIWWTFRDFRPSTLERNQEILRLRLYSAYAWGMPFILAIIAACVNLIPNSPLLRPKFGEPHCWFNDEHLAIFAYFFGPVGILVCINIMLFVSTTHQLTCGLWKRDDVKTTTEKTALGKICLKLVVVMGVTWIADILSWLIGGPDNAWFFTDLINALQGIFIFIVVGCQPQVWSACKRFCCRRSRQEITNTTNGIQHSSSSQGLPSLTACGGETTQNTSVGVTTISNSTQTTIITKIPMETVC